MKMKKDLKKTIILTILVFSMIFVGFSSAHADWATGCTITRINMNSPTGNTIVQATCGTTAGRVQVLDSEPGGNKIVATMLTAISLNTTVNINTANPFDDSGQVVVSLQMDNPN